MEIKAKKTGSIPQTPRWLPNLGVVIACAKRGGGKTTAITNYFRLLKEGSPDPYRFIIVSSTFDSNYSLMEDLEIDRDDILDPEDPNTAIQIRDIVLKEKEDLINFHEDMEKYRKFMKMIRKKNIEDHEDFEDLCLMFYNNENDQFEKPTHRWDGKKVNIVLFLDDCLGSKIMSSKVMLNTIIKNRHMGAFEPEIQKKYPAFGCAMGCFIYVATQIWKSTGGGIPRPLRCNASQLMLWKTASQVEKDNIYESLAGDIDQPTFEKVFDYATEEPHNFLLVDLAPKPHFPSMFRRNLDTFIVP